MIDDTLQTEYNAVLEKLATARRDLAQQSQAKDFYLDRVKKTPEWNEYIEASDYLSEVSQKVTDLEYEVKAKAMQMREAGAKDVPGVHAFKVFKTFIYEQTAAVKYAVEHNLTNLLRLDKTAFEKAVPTLNIEVVDIREEVRCQLQSDLSRFIPEPEPEPAPF